MATKSNNNSISEIINKVGNLVKNIDTSKIMSSSSTGSSSSHTNNEVQKSPVPISKKKDSNSNWDSINKNSSNNINQTNDKISLPSSSGSSVMDYTRQSEIADQKMGEITKDIKENGLSVSELTERINELDSEAEKIRIKIIDGNYKTEAELNALKKEIQQLCGESLAYKRIYDAVEANDAKISGYNNELTSVMEGDLSLENFESARDNLKGFQEEENSIINDKGASDVDKAFSTSNSALLDDMITVMNQSVELVGGFDNWKLNLQGFTDTLAYADSETMMQGAAELYAYAEQMKGECEKSDDAYSKSNNRREQFSNYIQTQINKNMHDKLENDVYALVYINQMRNDNANGTTEANSIQNLVDNIKLGLNGEGTLEIIDYYQTQNSDCQKIIDDNTFHGLLEKALLEITIETNTIIKNVYESNYGAIDNLDKIIDEYYDKFGELLNDGLIISDINEYLKSLTSDIKGANSILKDATSDDIAKALAERQKAAAKGIRTGIKDNEDIIKEYSKWKKTTAADYLKTKGNLTSDGVTDYISSNNDDFNKFYENLQEVNSRIENGEGTYSDYILSSILIGKMNTLVDNTNSMINAYNIYSSAQTGLVYLDFLSEMFNKSQTTTTTTTGQSSQSGTTQTQTQTQQSTNQTPSIEDRIAELEKANKRDEETLKHVPSSERDKIQANIDKRKSEIEALKYQNYCDQFDDELDQVKSSIKSTEHTLSANYLPSDVRDLHNKKLQDEQNRKAELEAMQSPAAYAAWLALQDAQNKANNTTKLPDNAMGIPTDALEKIKKNQEIAAQNLKDAQNNYDITVAGVMYNNEKLNNTDLKNKIDAIKNMVTEGYGMPSDASAYLTNKKNELLKQIPSLQEQLEQSNQSLEEKRKNYNFLNNSFITDLAQPSIDKKNSLSEQLANLQDLKNKTTNPTAMNEIQKKIDSIKSQISYEDSIIDIYYGLAEDLDDKSQLNNLLNERFNSGNNSNLENDIYRGLYSSSLLGSIQSLRDQISEYYDSPDYNEETMNLLQRKLSTMENEYKCNFDSLTMTTMYNSYLKSLDHVPSSERGKIEQKMSDLENRASNLGFDIKEASYQKILEDKKREEAEKKKKEEEEKNIFEKFADAIGNGIKEWNDSWGQFGWNLAIQNNEAAKNIHSFGDFVEYISKTTNATMTNSIIALWTGIEEAAEGLIDLGATAGTGLVSIGTSIWDLANGDFGGQNSLTSMLYDNAGKVIGTDWVGNANSALYQTDFGKELDSNSYFQSNSAAAGFLEGIGEVFGTMLMGKAFTNPQTFLASLTSEATGLSGSALESMTQKIGTTFFAGAKGFGRGFETAYADGADFQSSMAYGLASGLRESSEWLLGMGANDYFQGIMNADNATSAAISRAFLGNILFDTVDSASEGFVQPLLQLTYKNNDGIWANGIDFDRFVEQYMKTFEENGGIANVIEQALIGGMMSTAFSAGDAISASKKINNGAPTLGMKGTDEAHQITNKDYDVEVVSMNPDGTVRVDIENNPELSSFANRGKNGANSSSVDYDPKNVIDVEYRDVDPTKPLENTKDIIDNTSSTANVPKSDNIPSNPAKTNTQSIGNVPGDGSYKNLFDENLKKIKSNEIELIDNQIKDINTKLYTDELDTPTELQLRKELDDLKLKREKIVTGTTNEIDYNTTINTTSSQISDAKNWDTITLKGDEKGYTDVLNSNQKTIDKSPATNVLNNSNPKKSFTDIFGIGKAKEMEISNKTIASSTTNIPNEGSSKNPFSGIFGIGNNKEMGSSVNLTGSTINSSSSSGIIQNLKNTGAAFGQFIKNLPLMGLGKYTEQSVLLDTSISNRIKNEGLVHLTSAEAAASIIKDGKLNAKDTLPIYHDYDRAYMFAGNPRYDDVVTNVKGAEVMVGVRIKPTDAQIEQLKYRNIADNAVVHKGDFVFSPEQAEIVYYGLTRDANGKLTYAEIDAETAKNYHFDSGVKISALDEINAANDINNKARLRLYADYGAVSTPDLILKMVSDKVSSKVSSLFEFVTSPIKDSVNVNNIQVKINEPGRLQAEVLQAPGIKITDSPISKYIEDVKEFSEKRFESVGSEQLTNFAQKLGISEADAKVALDKKVADLVDNSEFGIRVRSATIEKIFESGKFKNSFELLDDGTFPKTAEMRRSAEKIVMNVSDNIDYADRPVYGMLFPKLNETNLDYDSYHYYGYENNLGSFYGDAIFVLDKGKIINDTTLCLSDTFRHTDNMTVTAANNPEFVGGHSKIFDNISSLEELKNAKLADMFPTNGFDQYAEFQIHGSENHGIDIIKEVIFTSSPSPEVTRILDENGIPWHKYDTSLANRLKNGESSQLEFNGKVKEVINVKPTDLGIDTSSADFGHGKIDGLDYESMKKIQADFENLADRMNNMTPEELLAYRESNIKPEHKPILDNLEKALTQHSERGGQINWQEKTLIGPIKQAMNEVLNANGPEGIKFVQKVIDLVNNPEFNGFASSRVRGTSNFNPYFDNISLAASTIDGNNIQTIIHEINHAMQNFYYKDGVKPPSNYGAIIKKTKEYLSNKNVKEFYSEYSETGNKVFNDDMQKFSSTIKAMQENLNEQRKSENHLVSKEKYKSEYEDYKKFGIMDYTDPENPVLKKFNANDDLSLTPEQLEDFNKIKEEKIFKHSDAYDELTPDIITYLYMKNMVSYPLDYLYQKFDRLLTDVRKDGDYITGSHHQSLSEKDFSAISEMISGIYGGTDTIMKKLGISAAIGHVDEYYHKKPSLAFEEAYVEFARLKEMNRTEALGLVKYYLGEDFYNMLDTEYNRVMNSFNDIVVGTAKVNGIAPNYEIKSDFNNLKNVNSELESPSIFGLFNNFKKPNNDVKVSTVEFVTPKTIETLPNLASTIYLDDAVKAMGEYYGDAGDIVYSLLKGNNYDLNFVKQSLSEVSLKKFEYFLENTISGRYLSKLSPEQMRALHRYTTSSFETINNALRENKVIDRDIAIIDSAIKEYGGLEKDTLLYRGATVSAFYDEGKVNKILFEGVDRSDPLQVYTVLKTLTGKEITDLGYMSTSPAYNTSYAREAKYNIVLEINAPKGTEAAYINQLSEHYNSENEMILARGTKFRIDEVVEPEIYNGNQVKVVVKCTIVNGGVIDG